MTAGISKTTHWLVQEKGAKLKRAKREIPMTKGENDRDVQNDFKEAFAREIEARRR